MSTVEICGNTMVLNLEDRHVWYSCERESGHPMGSDGGNGCKGTPNLNPEAKE